MDVGSTQNSDEEATKENKDRVGSWMEGESENSTIDVQELSDVVPGTLRLCPRV